MKKKLLISGLTGLFLYTSASLQKPKPINFDQEVVDNLSLLYISFYPDDFVTCLEKKALKGSILIKDFRLLPREKGGISTLTGIEERKNICYRYPKTIMTLHSHPNDGKDPNDYCYLSFEDISVFKQNGHEYIGIICERGIYWWNKSQVEYNEIQTQENQFIPFSERWMLKDGKDIYPKK